jgi:quinone-modifying oxidoreductase subunit QmoA
VCAAKPEHDSVLVIGGGISGMTAAIEAAEAGREVYLVEKEPYLGGRVARLHQYFPKNCPPSCGLEINYQRIKKNPRLHVLTDTAVRKIEGAAGNFAVTVRTAPQVITEKCTACGDCLPACTAEVPSAFNLGMSTTKAVGIPTGMAFPFRYHLEAGALDAAGLAAIAAACKYGAVDTAAAEKVATLAVGAIVVATGWTPYDAGKLASLGHGSVPDVVTNVQLERMASANGPTGGKIVRRSNGEPVKSVAFVQCAGSRDKNHLSYCSAVCCMASFKQARYVLAQDEAAEVAIFYIDRRTQGRLEDYLQGLEGNPKVKMVKGKVADVLVNPATGRLQVNSEATLLGELKGKEFDLVVLATGMVPNGLDAETATSPATDEWGFLVPGTPGIYPVGCAKRPVDVSTANQDATGTALRAMTLA